MEFGASGRESSEMVRSSAKSTRRERKSAQTAKSQAERFRTPPSSSHGSGVQHRPVKAETTPSSQTGTSRKTQGRSRRTESAKAGVHVGDGGGSVYRKTSLNAPCTQSPQITPTHPRLLDTMPAAHDLLAGQVVVQHMQCSHYTLLVTLHYQCAMCRVLPRFVLEVVNLYECIGACTCATVQAEHV